MTKTTEEAAKEYSGDANVRSENFCTEDIPNAFENDANYIMSLPLASRFTAEEKEQIKKLYRAAEASKSDYSRGYSSAIKRIFGKDFFKEGE